MKSTRKGQNPKKKNETNGYQKRTKKKGDREEREENDKTQTCAFWSTHIGTRVSCFLSNFLFDLGKKNFGGWRKILSSTGFIS